MPVSLSFDMEGAIARFNQNLYNQQEVRSYDVFQSGWIEPVSISITPI
jgi:hypothetical protein